MAHCYRCPGITVGDQLSKGQTIIKATLKKDLDSFSYTLIPTERKTLILIARWSKSRVETWTVMLAGPEECQKNKVVISLLDAGVYILLKNLVFYKEPILDIEFFINNDE